MRTSKIGPNSTSKSSQGKATLPIRHSVDINPIHGDLSRAAAISESLVHAVGALKETLTTECRRALVHKSRGLRTFLKKLVPDGGD